MYVLIINKLQKWCSQSHDKIISKAHIMVPDAIVFFGEFNLSCTVHHHGYPLYTSSLMTALTFNTLHEK